MVGCTQNENVNDEGYQNIENQQQEGLNNNANTIFVPKLYENKDWVYDAEYERNVEKSASQFKQMKHKFEEVKTALNNINE